MDTPLIICAVIGLPKRISVNDEPGWPSSFSAYIRVAFSASGKDTFRGVSPFFCVAVISFLNKRYHLRRHSKCINASEDCMIKNSMDDFALPFGFSTFQVFIGCKTVFTRNFKNRVNPSPLTIGTKGT